MFDEVPKIPNTSFHYLNFEATAPNIKYSIMPWINPNYVYCFGGGRLYKL